MSLFFGKFFDADNSVGGETSVNTAEVAEQSQGDEDAEVVYTSKDQLEEEESSDEPEAEASSVTADTANQQSAEENSRYAAMRRRAEAEAEKKFKAMQESVDMKFAAMFSGYNNPVTGKPIKTAADYAEAFAAQQKQQQEKQLKDAGIDPELINKTVQQEVQSNPAIQQAQAVLAKQQQDEANRMIEEDIQNIGAIDPTVSSIQDLQAQDNFKDVVAYCNSHPGARLSDAYKIINFDRLTNVQKQAAKQAAINQAKSKNHLNKVSGLNGATEGDDIPSAEFEKWKEWFPEKSAKELRALYNKSKKAGK